MEKNLCKRFFFIAVLVALPVIFILVSMMMGSYHTSPGEIFRIFAEKITGQDMGVDEKTVNLFWTIRFPRVVAACLGGAGLSLSGAVFQSMFKNPLASPYTLGVSNGAGFGAALGIVLSLGTVGVQGLSACFGLASIGITFLLASRSKSGSTTLILAGMLVSALFSSLVALLKFMADPFEKLPQIVFWLMGSFSGSSQEKVLYILPVYVIAFVLIWLYRWKINVMSMGDQEAASYGVNVKTDRLVVILAASVLTSMVVSISGIISWVGIVVPHLARMIVGPDFRKICPVSVSLGICYLLLIDGFCRAVSTAEIPIGVVTGIIGAPLFMYFIMKKKVDW